MFSKINQKLMTFDSYFSIKTYRARFGRFPNLLKPTTFNERLLVKKLFDRNLKLKIFADKVAVREYVAASIGPHYLVPVHQIVSSVDDINLKNLPDAFVIKASHGSGWNYIVKDKSRVCVDSIREFFKSPLETDFYSYGREWCYKNLKKRLLVEKLLLDCGKPPVDYKFFCFNGAPKFFQVDFDRFDNHTRSLFDLRGNIIECGYEYPRNYKNIDLPDNLPLMIEVAKKLCRNMDFVRVDLYSVEGRIYFGELTNYPENGLGRFTPVEYDKIFGAMWVDNN